MKKRRSIRNKERGFGALEVLIVLLISTLAIAGATPVYMRYLDRQSNLVAGGHMSIVADAAERYIKDNYAAVVAAATPSAPAVITTAMLRSTGYLPVGFADQNPYGQDYQILALEPTSNKLQTLIVTQNGETIKELYLIEIAKQIGAKGGYISTFDTAVATGSFGGWKTTLGPYGVTPGAGHLATALFFDDGALVNDYLYRHTVPGQPELQKMHAAIDMSTNNLNNAGEVNAASVNVIANTRTAGETYTGGWFRSTGDTGWYNEKHGGGWYMTDPTWVRSYGDKNVYTGGEMRAGKLTSGGRTEVGEYLQLNGLATEGTACSPNGLIGKNASGPLFCDKLIWKLPGLSPSLPITLALYPAARSSNYCTILPNAGIVTGSAAGSTALSINGVVVGTGYGYSGRYVDVAIDNSISGLVPAGQSFCFSNRISHLSMVHGSGFRVVVSYLN